MVSDTARFLLVEDNDLDVEKITQGFMRLKISNKIIRAKDGYDALNILRGTNGKVKLKTPYIILLDLNMPKMNGLEFLEVLRADDAIAHSPVIILTTSDRQQDIESAYVHNVCGYIVKPVKIQQMFEALSALNMFWNLCELPLGKMRT